MPLTRTFARCIHDGICAIDRLLTSNAKAQDALARAVTPTDVAKARRELEAHRIELIRIQREMREIDQELTPVRPPSRDDMRAALRGAQNFGTGAKERKP